MEAFFMNYQKIHNDIINRAKSRLLEGYSENHHIIPRCMGGSDELINLVKLTPEEHYVVHQLLVKLNPEHSGLSYAALKMCIGPNGHRSKNKSYGWIRKKYSKNLSKQLRVKTKHNCPRVEKAAMTLSKRRTGETKYNCPRVAKSALANAITRLGQTKETCDRVAKQSITLTGRTKKTHQYLGKNGLNHRSLTPSQEIELFQMRNNGMIARQIRQIFFDRGTVIAVSSVYAIYNRLKIEFANN